MLALYIIGGIILLFALILSLKATVTVAYHDEVTLSVRVLFVKLRILPKKKKKGPHRMSAKKAEKIKKKLRRKQEKKAEKKQLKAKKKAAKKDAPKEEKKKMTLPEILDMISLIRKLLAKVVKTFFGHLRMDVVRLKIRVATGDAATTALAYGAITQSVNVLFPILDSVKNISLPKTRDIDIVADFAGEEIEADVEFSFSLRLWHLLHVAFAALGTAIKHFIKKIFRDQKKAASGHTLPNPPRSDAR